MTSPLIHPGDNPLLGRPNETNLYVMGKWEAMMPRTHPRRRDCAHPVTVSVIADGLERVVCEDCGQVTIRYESMISGDVKRSQFSRRADKLAGAAHNQD